MKRIILGGMVLLLAILCTACVSQVELGDGNPIPATQPVREAVNENLDANLDLDSDTLSAKPEKGKEYHCIVQVQTDNRRGSAVLWDKQETFWCFITAAHVVENLDNVEIYFPEADKICVASVRLVEGLDLAFLQLDIPLLPEQTMTDVACLDSLTEVKQGEDIVAVGYNASAEKLQYTGSVWEPWIYVEDFENYMLMCECEAVPGMSGGAVYTRDGALVGIVCGQNAEGMIAVLPSAVIEAQYALFINN